MSASIDGMNPDSWVVKRDIIDADIGTKYLHSIYWAFTTVTTVGYGDISGFTNFEMSISICWMLFGVGFYSFTIGSLSSFLSTIDSRDSIMNEKLAAVNEFSKETGISERCKKKIVNVIKYNTAKIGAIFSEKHSLFDELPKKLKYEVVISMYDGIVAELPFFKNRDIAFVVYVMQRMRPFTLVDGDYIYHEGELASEVFVIAKGRVSLVDEHEIGYKSFLRGSLIGEVELILKTTRLDNVQICGDTEFLVMKKSCFLSMLKEFPSIAREISVIAKEKAKRNKVAKFELIELLKLKNRGGNLNELAGKENFMSKKQIIPITVEPDDEER